MTIMAGDVFSAFKAAGVDDETAKRAAADVGDIKELTSGYQGTLGSNRDRAHVYALDPRDDRDRLTRHRRRRVRRRL